MEKSATAAMKMDGIELPSLLATLCSYECFLGPYHPPTLGLLAHVAIAPVQAGVSPFARGLLERGVRDIGRYLDRDHDLRLRALTTLRDVVLAQRDYERACAVQAEILECQIQCPGSVHPDTLTTRNNLATILIETSPLHRDTPVSPERPRPV